MLEEIKSKLKDEQVQRTLLRVGGLAATYVATRVVSHYMGKGIAAGIDALMEKWHPTEEVAAES